MATETLRPNAAGDETNIHYQYPDSGYHWDKVDEATPDDASTRIWNSDGPSPQRDLYNLPASSIPDGSTINSIKIYFRCCKETDNTCYAAPSYKKGGTVYDGDNIIPSTYPTWTTYSQQWSTPGWTKEDINNLQIGVKLTSNTYYDYCWCTQVYVEIDYTEVTPKTSSDSGSGVDAKVAYLASLSKSDSGTGIEHFKRTIEGEVSTLLAELPAEDAGAGVELPSLIVIVVSDSGTGLDTSVPSVSLQVLDIGAGVEQILDRGLVLSDSGLLVDSSVLAAALTESDIGAALPEVASLLSSILGSDSGLGTDATITFIVVLVRTETGSAVDASLLSTITEAIETGAGVDVIKSLVRPRVDSGTGLDAVIALLAIKTTTDSGVGVDKLLIRIYEAVRENLAVRNLNVVRQKTPVRKLPY